MNGFQRKLDYSAQNGRAPLKDRKDDLYETPPIAVEKLLKVESLPVVIWEPACGPGSISKTLMSAGHEVYSTDLVDYGHGHSGIDFLMEHRAPSGISCIVTNPPYKLMNQFVRHAIDICPLVAMLLRLAFLESQSRSDLIFKLSRCHVFGKRLPRMHRAGFTGKPSSSSVAFAWFIWDRHHSGPTILDQI